MIERQEIFCHECQSYVQFDIDTSLDGNHVLTCPKCGHEHCRVVQKGIITDVRWGQRNTSLPTYNVQTYSITFSNSSAGTNYVDMGTTSSAAAPSILMSAWSNFNAIG